MSKFKFFLLPASVLLLAGTGLSGCSTNPATGERQFTALMSPQQEQTVGAQEHQKVIAQYGLYEDQQVQNYVKRIGEKVTADTERPDVDYKFYVVDSPEVNAFALPGGYIYVSRGLMALANNEAELAAVLGHEAGHMTARHSAERYSQTAVTSIGANVLGAVIGSSGASQALGLGANLYLSSYSRGQENEADSLGIRYLERSGYDPDAMTWFLTNLQNHSELQARSQGKEVGPSISYFSTHPATSDRISKTRAEGGGDGQINRDAYLKMVSGITFGDSAAQGFVREGTFYHPGIGFAFDVPQSYNVQNNPSEVAVTGQSGAVMLFDMASNDGRLDPMTYLRQIWMNGESRIQNPESVTVNGMPAATASFNGTVNGRAMTIQLMAIKFSDTRVARFQVGVPSNISSSELNALKSATYSFRRINSEQAVTPPRIDIVAAGAGDTVASMSARMAVPSLKEDYFRVYNAMGRNDQVRPGELYKLIVY